MRHFLIAACALGLIAGPALADEVIVTTTAPAEGVVVEKHDDTVKKVVRRDADGCATKTVTKSDGMGDSVSKTNTNC